MADERPAEERYTMDDLRALIKTKGYPEILEHVGDVRPAARDSEWENILHEATEQQAERAIKEKTAAKWFPVMEDVGERFPQLFEHTPFLAMRRKLGMAAYNEGRSQWGDQEDIRDALVNRDDSSDTLLLLATADYNPRRWYFIDLLERDFDAYKDNEEARKFLVDQVDSSSSLKTTERAHALLRDHFQEFKEALLPKVLHEHFTVRHNAVEILGEEQLDAQTLRRYHLLNFMEGGRHREAFIAALQHLKKCKSADLDADADWFMAHKGFGWGCFQHNSGDEHPTDEVQSFLHDQMPDLVREVGKKAGAGSLSTGDVYAFFRTMGESDLVPEESLQDFARRYLTGKVRDEDYSPWDELLVLSLKVEGKRKSGGDDSPFMDFAKIVERDIQTLTQQLEAGNFGYRQNKGQVMDRLEALKDLRNDVIRKMLP